MRSFTLTAICLIIAVVIISEAEAKKKHKHSSSSSSRKGCPGKHEKYKTCGTSCPETCHTLGKNIVCDKKCNEGCFCKKGYVRNGHWKCVKPEKCHRCPGRHETYKKCGTSCPETCDTLGQNQFCVLMCKSGCFCKKGYVRNNDWKCVKPDKCPPPPQSPPASSEPAPPANSEPAPPANSEPAPPANSEPAPPANSEPAPPAESAPEAPHFPHLPPDIAEDLAKLKETIEKAKPELEEFKKRLHSQEHAKIDSSKLEELRERFEHAKEEAAPEIEEFKHRLEVAKDIVAHGVHEATSKPDDSAA